MEIRAKPRRDIGGNRDAADPAHGIECERGFIVARQLEETLAASEALRGDAPKISGGIFHAGDIPQLCDLGQCLDRDVDHRAAGDVVNDDRQRGGVRHRLEGGDHPILTGPVVIAHDDQSGIGPDIGGGAQIIDRMSDIVAAAAGDHRYAPLGDFDRRRDDVPLLVGAHRRAFARGPARHERVAAFRNLPLDQLAQCVLGDTATGKGRHQGRN